MYLYIVSLVVILRNWVCDNWVYQFPKYGEGPDWEIQVPPDVAVLLGGPSFSTSLHPSTRPHTSLGLPLLEYRKKSQGAGRKREGEGGEARGVA